MPRADYQCPGCPGIIHTRTFSAAVGAIASAPWCEVCEIQMEWIPFARFDLKSDGESAHGPGGKGGFQKFTVHRLVPTKDGPKQVEETIDSLHKLRQLEKDSEQRFRDGEGEPLRFRAYSQEQTNQDVGLFGAYVPEASKLKKSGRVSVKAVTPADGSEPAVETGPGMHGTPLALAEDH